MSFLRRLRGEPNVPRPADVAPVYTQLRQAVLDLDPTSVGIERGPAERRVWGLVMDWSVGDAIATIVSLADGTTSLYLSSGGGSIGAGEHEAPAAASINAIRVADAMVDEFPMVEHAPIPGRGRTALTLLTDLGLRRVEEDNAAFEEGTSRFAPVADAMQHVIHEIRVAEAGSPARRSPG